MAATGRQFVIELIARTKGAQRSLDLFGQKFNKIKTPMVAGLAVIAAGFAAITAATYKVVSAVIELGTEFNDAYRTLQAGTGQTGDDLAKLEQSFRNVFSTGADSMDDVASVMAELDSRFDTLSNRRLERLTRQFLDLGGLVGEDAVGLVESLTQAFNRFDTPAHMAGETLDTLFRIAQETGYSLSELGGQTENYGVGLDRLGLNLVESAAFLALLEREGVAASRIFPSLNTAASKLAREGVGDVETGIANLIDELRNMDQAAAEAKAADMLGSDFGNFLEVIRDSKFDYEAFIESLGVSQDVITDTAAETDGLREKWDTFKNYLKVTFEPAAMLVFDALSEAIDGLIPAVDRVKEAFEEDGLEGALEQVKEEWDRIYEGPIKELFEDKFVPFLTDTVKPLVIQAGLDIGADFAKAIWNALSKWFKDNWTNLVPRLFRQLLPSGLPVTLFEDFVAPNLPEFDYSGPIGTGAGRVDFTLPDVTGSGGGGVRLMAEGGIVTSPTLAVIGEAGPEAVIPLDRSGPMGGGTTVNVYVNGGDPEAVVDAIRRYTRANGPLGQVVPV